MEPEAQMPTLTLKNLPESLYHQLKARAAANRRSLNSEILTCLEQAMAAEPVGAAEARARLARADAVRARLVQHDVRRLTEAALRSAKASGRP
jgi:plasmid stability protein